MRRRIVRLTVTAAVLAIALFGLPLAAIVSTYVFNDERSELSRAAETGALRLSAELANGQELVTVPALEPDMTAALYDRSGTTVSGNGTDARSRAANDRVVRRVQEKFGAEIRTVIDQSNKR